MCGGLKGQVILNKKSWFSYQDMVIHENEGPISTIAFAYPFVAWCNEYGTKVYNVEQESSVTYVPKPEDVPSTNEIKPKLWARGARVRRRCWYGNSRLVIGWGEVLTSVQLNFKSPATGNRIWFGEQGAVFRVGFWINGVAIFDADRVSLLAYNKAEGVEPPSIHVVSLRSGESESEECLPIRDFETLAPADYQFEWDATAPSSAPQPVFLLAPRMIVRVTPRSQQDHIDWAVAHHDFPAAIAIAERSPEFSAQYRQALKEQHLDYLFAQRAIPQAAAICPAYCGKDAQMWERWIARFNGIQKLQLLLPYIPLNEPRLPLPVYTLVLNYVLYNDVKAFLGLIRAWPRPLGNSADLYDPKGLVSLLEQMKASKPEPAVQEALALLYEMTGDVDRGIACYLEGSLTNVADAPVFEWVEKYEKVAVVAQKALVLFRLSCKQAATLFVNHMEEVPVGVPRGGEA